MLPVSLEQLHFSSIEEQVSADNVVRFIEAFVEKIGLALMHFVVKKKKEKGSPAFNPKLFLKFYAGHLSITWTIAKILFPINLKFMGKVSYAF